MWAKLIIALVGVMVAYTLYPQDDKLHTLKGKRVVVTGASDGIGKQIAFHYARLGAQVVVTARRQQILNEVVKECQALSPSPNVKHVAVPADMSNMNETKKVIEHATRHMGGLDILVLNHGALLELHLWEGTSSDLEEFDLHFNIGARSYIYMATHALPHLLASEGNIIVMNSVSGKVAHASISAYTLIKYALTGFFSSLQTQFEMFGQNVAVTNCYLGLINTASAVTVMEKAGVDLDKFPAPAPVSGTALDIIKASARRQDDVYIPYYTVKLSIILNNIWPSLYNYLMKQSIEGSTQIQLKKAKDASS